MQAASDNISAETHEWRVGVVAVQAQHARAVYQRPKDARKKHRVALAYFALLLAFSNSLHKNPECPCTHLRRLAARVRRMRKHDFEMSAVLVGETDISNTQGFDLRREAARSALFGLFLNIYEVDETGFTDGGQQRGFIFEMPVSGGTGYVQAFADLAQGKRRNAHLLN